MSRSDHRRLAARFIIATIALAACALCWLSVLTFSPADPPSDSVWPLNDRPANWCAAIGAGLAFRLFHAIGLGTYPLLILATGALIGWTRGRKTTDLWLRLIGVGLICASTATAAAIFIGPSERFLLAGPGGIVGAYFATILVPGLSTLGSVLLIVCTLVVGLLVAADQAMIGFLRWTADMTQRSGPGLAKRGRQALANAGAAVNAVATGMTTVTGKLVAVGAGANGAAATLDPSALPKKRATRKAALFEEDDAEPEEDESVSEVQAVESDPDEEADDEAIEASDEADEEVEVAPAKPAAPVAAAKADDIRVRDVSPKRESAPYAPPAPRDTGDYKLPDISMLEDPDPIDKESIEILCREKAYILEQTLNEFRLEVKVASIETGPVITVFELKLAPGIKVSQIASLTNDMARALKAPAVRVVAPLPGRNTIGIEVPNLDKEKVRVKDLMMASSKRSESYALPLYLGKDASGQPLVSDLTKMPHMLIAGTTGSGKSVCVSSVIGSILMTRTPDEAQMILVDPKVVELAMFKDIPHLMCPIVTEMSKAESILDWAATKMDERYALLAEAGVKDIKSYNRLGKDELAERMGIEDEEEMARIPVHMPYIVIVIDELADLMMTSAKEVEFYLCRLAQKSRAVGIHLIVSTQRPQANVVTGLIKSNLPSRIAFRVSSRLDSRIVLDQNGGEVLMGQGDMLFLPPGQSKLVRAQGTYISDDELRALVKHAKAQRQPNYHPELMRMPKTGESAGGERDELFDDAVEMIIQSGRGSVSLLQRKLTIGYGRASRLIDQMYDAGIVGEYKGSQAREVAITKEDWDRIRAARDREEAAIHQGELEY